MKTIESETLLDDPTMKIEWLPGTADRIVLCFTGVGHVMGEGERDAQGREFTGTALRYGTPVFLYDKERSWGSNLDFAQMAEVLAPVIKGREVVSVGNSMGAFLAIAATKHLPISRCFAFGPQFSVDPAVVPREKRWMKYRENIKEYRLSSLAGHFNDSCRYFIFSGATLRERRHWRNFPEAANIFSFILPDSDHDVASDLKASGRLTALLDVCMERDRSRSALCKTFGFRLPD